MSRADSPPGPRRLRAEAALLVTTLLWATTSVAGRWLVGEDHAVRMPEPLVLGVRFSLAAALLAIATPSACRMRDHGRDWRVGLWLGALLGITFYTQLVGQRTIPATRSHFITNLSVLIVPLLQTVHLQRRPGRGPLVGVALALGGLCLLTDPFHGRLLTGDAWTLGCALAYSLYIIELQRLGPGIDLPRLLFVQFLVIAIASWVLAIPTGGLAGLDSVAPTVWGLLIYLAVICTLGATWLHNRFQRDTTPTRAALIFVTGPVMTFALAWLMLGEGLSALQLTGAGLILAAILVAEIV